MTLHIPVRMYVLRIVLLIAADLDLFISPLWENRVRSTKVTSKLFMAEPQPRRERMYTINLFALDIIHDLDLPIIAYISNSRVAVAGNFIVELRDGREDGVGVEVTRSGGMLQSDDVPIFEEPQLFIRVILFLLPPWENDPIIVVVFVVVASNLLLVGTDGICLHV